MPYALITGASKGIGKAFAQKLAERHHDVLLVSRSGDLLKQLADELISKYKIKAYYLPLDLSILNASEKILEWIQSNQFEVDILINNAGYGLWGKFSELDLNEQEEMIRVNIHTLVHLTHKMIPVLQKQKKSYILNVSSTTAYQAIPTLAVYAAAKSFILSFTRSLSHEMKGTNISVSCLSPGTTKTDFVERSRMYHMKALSDKMSMTPKAVAAIGLKGMFAGKREIIPGVTNKVGAFLAQHAPKWLTEKTAAGIYKKK